MTSRNRARQVNQRNDPGMLADKITPLGKRQHEVQEQRRLQQPGSDVAPQNDPVEGVEFSGVVERVEDERNQAENIEVHGAWRRPAPQQHVHSDAQIDERDQPQPEIQRPLRRNQNHSCVNWNGVAHQRISRLRPDAGAEEHAYSRGRILDLVLIDGRESVAAVNTGFIARPIGFHAVGSQRVVVLHPANAIGWNHEFRFFLEIDPREDDGGRGQKNEQTGGKTNLEVPVHGARRLGKPRGQNFPLTLLHVRCHRWGHHITSNMLQRKHFHDYRRAVESPLWVLEVFCGIW